MSVRHTNAAPDPAVPGPGTSRNRLTQFAAWPALLAGAGVGLIIGLILAWGVWPVQWVNAWPGDLNPEARAHYIAAVAEAYAYYGDDRAVEIARQRLYDLNNNLAEEIAAAQAYFNDTPQRESRIYIVNMGQLAQALNVQSPDILLDADIPETAPTAPPALVGPTLIDWLNWIFVIIAALVLISGGVYIVYERSKRRQAQESDVIFTDINDDEIGGFEEDDWDTDESAGAVYRRPLASPTLRANAPPEGDAYFVDEDDDPTSFRDVDASGRGYGGQPFTRPDTLPDLDYGDDHGKEEPARPIRDVRPPTAAVAATERKPTPAQTPKPTKARPPKSGEPKTTAPVAPLAGADEPVEMEVLGEYTVQYLAGLLDYDEPQDIIDSATGNIIGECGMGVNMKNGYLQNNPEHVIALDVYLFDKRDDERYLSQNRILFCDYVVDNKLEHSFSKERPNDPDPLVAKPRAKFQLTNSTLVMDCEILEVDFVKEGDAKGIFQNLKLHMQVRAVP